MSSKAPAPKIPHEPQEKTEKWINGKLFKRFVVKPDKYGVVTYTDGFIGESIDAKGAWHGWFPDKEEPKKEEE